MAREQTYRDKLKQIRNSALQPVYVITGTEEYFREIAIEMILKNRAFSDDEPPVVQKYFGDDVDDEKFSINLASYSLFAEKKIIIVRRAHGIKSTCWAHIEDYLQKPDDTTVLVLEDESLDRRIKAVKAVTGKAALYDFPKLRGDQLVAWLRSYTEKKKVTFDSGALRLFVELVEPPLRNYINECEKIILFAGDRESLTAQDVADIVQKTRGFDVFKFTHALCSGDTPRTLEYVKLLLLYNESTPGILVMTFRHVKNLLKIKSLAGRVHNRQELSRITGINRKFINQYAEQADSISANDIYRLLEIVLEAETNYKTGRFNEKMVLTLLIQQFRSVLCKGAA